MGNQVIVTTTNANANENVKKNEQQDNMSKQLISYLVFLTYLTR